MKAMNKTLLTAIIILAFLIFIEAETHFDFVKANPYIPPLEPITYLPTLEIQTPQNFTTHKVDSTTLNFTVTRPGTWFYYTQFQEINYALDGGKSQVLFLREQKANLGDGDGLETINQYSSSY